MDRKKVIKELSELHGSYETMTLIRETIALLKEQEPKTGTWQWKIHGKPESGGTLGEAICDQCGKSTYATAVKGDLNYCPNCGAKMTDRK